MTKTLLTRAWLTVSVFAAIGLMLGVLLMYVWVARAEKFAAQATLAMLPVQDVPASEASNYWEVLNRGQATRSAAVVLGDQSWLDGAASAAGVPKSDLALSAGAIPDTTLITVTMEAQSPNSAETALQAVLNNAVGTAAAVSGPFRLDVVASPSGSAHSMSASRVQMLGAFGIAGLLVGAGCGVLVSRSIRSRSSVSAPSRPSSDLSAVGRRKHARSEAYRPTDSGVDDEEADTTSLRITSR